MQLTGLNPDTVYDYRVTSGSDVVDSTFTTAPASTSCSFRFLVYGDNRNNPPIHQIIIDGIRSKNPKFVINEGDMVGSGTIYSEWGEQFFNQAQDLMKTTPLFPVVGNHELYGDNSTNWHEHLFYWPDNTSYYAFTYGCVRIICLDTNIDFSIGFPQYIWLESELQSSPCQGAAWVFVNFHHPPPTTRNKCTGMMRRWE